MEMFDAMNYKRTILSAIIIGVSASLCLAPVILSSASTCREGYIQVEGGRVWYRMVGDKGATPLLVLHGGPGFPSYYLKPLARLADERPVIFYDQLGCGHSDRPNVSSLWQVARFVAELQTVRDSLGLKEVYIFGHSWGASLAIDYLCTHPRGVKGLILAGPFLSAAAWRRDAEALLATLPDSVTSALRSHEKADTTNTEEYHRLMEEYYTRFVTRIDPPPPDVDSSIKQSGDDVYRIMWGPSEFRVTGLLKDYEREAELGSVAVPTLFTAGKYDQAAPLTVRSFQQLTPGSRFEIFENSSHMPMQEEPGRYIEVLRDFLDEADHK
jgi:proline iminopeptidase